MRRTRSPNSAFAWVVAGLSVTLLAVAHPAAAEYGFRPPVPLNSNSPAGASEFNPEVAGDGRGVWVAVWESTDQLGGTFSFDTDILWARSADDGLTWSAPQAMNEYHQNDQVTSPIFGEDERPTVATDGEGTWIAVWAGAVLGTESVGGDVKWRRSTDNGLTWSASQPLNLEPDAPIRGSSASARVVHAGGDEWMVLFTSSAQIETGVPAIRRLYAARSTDGGVAWGAPARVDHLPSGVLRRCGIVDDVVHCGGGVWLAVWESMRAIGAPEDPWGFDTDIFYTRSTDNGVAWEQSRPISDAFSAMDESNDSSPRLASDALGNCVLVWRSFVTQGAFDIWVARSSSTGAIWDSPTNPLVGLEEDQAVNSSPAIATDGNGLWLFPFRTDAPQFSLTAGLLLSTDNGGRWDGPYALAMADSSMFPHVLVFASNGTWILTALHLDRPGVYLSVSHSILPMRSAWRVY